MDTPKSKMVGRIVFKCMLFNLYKINENIICLLLYLTLYVMYNLCNHLYLNYVQCIVPFINDFKTIHLNTFKLNILLCMNYIL